MSKASIERMLACTPPIAKPAKKHLKDSAPAVYPSVVGSHPLPDKRHGLPAYDLDLMDPPVGSIPGRGLTTDRVLWSVDVETTGLNHFHDRIVQLAAIPYHPDGTRGPARVWFFNPEVEVSKEAEAVHHLSNEALRDQPKFAALGKEIYDLISAGDLAGYNIKAFDIRMMRNAFARLGYTFPKPGTRIVDAFRIFRSNVTRDSAGGNHRLNTAHRFYCGTDIRDAHDAEADAHATLDVLLRQVAVHGEIPTDVADLHTYTHDRRSFARADTYQRSLLPDLPKLRPYIRAPLRITADSSPTRPPTPPIVDTGADVGLDPAEAVSHFAPP